MSSDHFAPWSERQGHSGFMWACLGAALASTQLPFGLVTTPSGWRYHPALVAQAGATAAEMFPGRLWMALGSGEALNELVVGGGWPAKAERTARLTQAVEIIRALWAGETVTTEGPIRTEKAKLYTLPMQAPALIGAALTVETARWCGSWADGLITINKPRDYLVRMIEAFRVGGGEGKPIYLQAHLSWAASDDEARQNAFDQWRSNVLTVEKLAGLETPAEYDQASVDVEPGDLDPFVRISADPGQHRAWLEDDAQLGFEAVYLHNVGKNQLEFIEAFGREILPQFRA